MSSVLYKKCFIYVAALRLTNWVQLHLLVCVKQAHYYSFQYMSHGLLLLHIWIYKASHYTEWLLFTVTQYMISVLVII